MERDTAAVAAAPHPPHGGVAQGRVQPREPLRRGGGLPRAASLATSSRTALTTTVSARSEVGRGEDDGKGGDGTVTAVRGRFDGDSEEKREDDGVERAVR